MVVFCFKVLVSLLSDVHKPSGSLNHLSVRFIVILKT